MSACTARSTRHGSARVPTSPSTSSSATIPGEFTQDSDIAHRRKFTTPGWKAKKQREADRNPVRKTRGCSTLHGQQVRGAKIFRSHVFVGQITASACTSAQLL